jgi:transcriptional regulator with XRE-family HTH domain
VFLYSKREKIGDSALPTVVNVTRLKELIKAKGLDISSLARMTGLSRQGLYRFLQADCQPLVKGFQTLADALDVSPVALLQEQNGEIEKWSEIKELLEQASMGEARAFEVLPWTVYSLSVEEFRRRDTLDSIQHRLLAAAAETACCLRPNKTLKKLILAALEFCEPNAAFFFSAHLMSAQRVVLATPLPMKKHLVFGAFDMRDFERHFETC